MRDTLHFLEQHGALVVFIAVLLEQIGVPIPSSPVLLAAGALAGAGKFSLTMVIALATIASLLGDIVWYILGRRKGQSILNLLCRISLEPDSCASTTKGWFSRLGASSLLIAKFVPGLSTAAPPMAGATRMSLARFTIFDLAGSLIWSGAFALLGVLFSPQLERVLEVAAQFGLTAGAVLFLIVAAYLGTKFYQRQRFLKDLRAARITPEDLMQIMETPGCEVSIIDLRSTVDLGDRPERIPGALWFSSRDFEQRHSEIPRDRDIILYCS